MEHYAYAEFKKNLTAVFAAATREKVAINFPDGKRFHLQSVTDLQSATDIAAPVKKSPRRTRTRKSKNPNNPSPAGDPYFDDPRNIAAIMRGIRQVKEGKVTKCRNREELHNFLAGLGYYDV
ncbi:MAG: hypothetical protein LBP75_00975 [Planctomycetota bacterium]|jgi:hypothetical protein|nr:hypothetical protein [Planctomycetota bacterium]